MTFIQLAFPVPCCNRNTVSGMSVVDFQSTLTRWKSRYNHTSF